MRRRPGLSLESRGQTCPSDCWLLHGHECHVLTAFLPQPTQYIARAEMESRNMNGRLAWRLNDDYSRILSLLNRKRPFSLLFSDDREGRLFRGGWRAVGRLASTHNFSDFRAPEMRQQGFSRTLRGRIHTAWRRGTVGS